MGGKGNPKQLLALEEILVLGEVEGIGSTTLRKWSPTFWSLTLWWGTTTNTL